MDISESTTISGLVFDWRRRQQENEREAKRWAGLARLAIDPDHRAFAEGQQKHFARMAIRMAIRAIEAGQ